MNDKKKIIYILIAIVILIIIALGIMTFINRYKEQNSNLENQSLNIEYNTTTIDEDSQNRDRKVATLSESQRMQTYFGRYLSYIESKDYQSAYDLLYDGFKQNYFPTLEEFIEYVQNNYPNNIVVEYVNIERQGTIFILTVKLRDALTDTTQTDTLERQVVVTENDINNFKISFSVNS